jgi:hypothetical protein
MIQSCSGSEDDASAGDASDDAKPVDTSSSVDDAPLATLADLPDANVGPVHPVAPVADRSPTATIEDIYIHVST